MSLGTRLKSARLAKHYTQKQLGEMVNVTGAAIGNYENSVSSPNEDTLIKLMSALGVDANYLYADDMTDIRGVYFLSPEEERLISMFRGLNFNGQQMVITSVESFAGNPALTEDMEAGAS